MYLSPFNALVGLPLLILSFLASIRVYPSVLFSLLKSWTAEMSIVNYDPNRENEEYEVHFVDDDTLYYDELTIIQCLRGDTFGSCK